MNFKDQLQQAINNEDYERAEELKKLIESGEEFIYKNILITHGERYINDPDLTEKIKDSLDRTTRILNKIGKPDMDSINNFLQDGGEINIGATILRENPYIRNSYKLKHRIKNLIKRIDWYYFISGILMGLIGYIYGIIS